MDETQTQDAKDHWEQHYSERGQIWSGRVNTRLADIVTPFKPGAALDLGCGEGGDAVWLAEQGWHVTAVDIADTALQRAAQLAKSHDVSDRIEFAQHNLATSFPEGTFDLISAQFLHSKLPLDRPRILKRAIGVVRPGGVLVVVDHAGPPPWASKLHGHHDFPSADEVVAALDLTDADWERVQVEAMEREAKGPDGELGTLVDNVVVLRRRGG
jgi:SAM-dependent methyltransferase